MLEKLKRLLAKSENSTAIEAALAEIDVPALEADLSAAQQRRTDLLLTGSDADIVAAERKVETARLAIDRAEAARAELETRLAAARTREFDEDFLRQWQEADDAQAVALEVIRTTILPAAHAIDDALLKINLADAKRQWITTLLIRHNAEDNAAGRGGFVETIENRLDREGKDYLPSWARNLVFQAVR